MTDRSAKEKVVEAQGTLTRTTSVMADAKTKSDTASDELDTATDNLNNAIANKQKEVKARPVPARPSQCCRMGLLHHRHRLGACNTIE